MTNQTLTYADAGVDIDAGNALVERIKPAVKATNRAGVMGGIGGFGGLFDLKKAGFEDPILVAATDGVGTKLLLAQEAQRFNTVGIDLVAMCVNDLVVQGAEPLFFLDYYACGKLEVEQAAQVVEGIAEGCKTAGCALIGGETAEMPGLYPKGEYDLAGFCVGAAERNSLYPRDKGMREGDVVLGLASDGVHSNGFSLVRHVLKARGVKLGDACSFADGKSWTEELLTPTRIYVKSCLEAIRFGGVLALAHITGGGLTENIPRILPDNLGVNIDLGSWQLPPVFEWLHKNGPLSDEELLRTFNSGIGMVLVVEHSQAEAIKRVLKSEGEQVHVIGTVTARGEEAVAYTGAFA